MKTDLISCSALLKITCIASLIVGLLLFNGSDGVAQLIIPYQSAWKYAPESAIAPVSTWNTSGFADATWKTGNAPFGFGSHFYNTRLQRGPNDATPDYPAYYFRKMVNIASAGAYTSFRLRAYLDDGIVIYINGIEVKRKNMNADPTNPYTGSAGDSLTIDTLISTSLFHDGDNLIAAEVHQTGISSSDILFDLHLEGQTPSLFRYPYLQLASHDQMTICWYTTSRINATVRYSTNSDLEIYEEISSAKNDTLHSVTLKNLYSDTKYYYKVGYYLGSEFRELQYNPSVNYFRTLSSPADTSHSLRFWLLGDSGAGTYRNPRPFKVRDAYLAYLNDRNNPNVDGILFLGDNSNTQKYEGLQLALDTTLFRFYNRPNDQQLLSHIPSWTVMGNHDYGPSNDPIPNIRKAYHQQIAASFTTFAFPDSAQIGGEPTYNKKGYYSFDQGNIHFVVLNPYLIEGSSDFTYTDVYGYKEISHRQSIARNPTLDDAIDDQEQVKWLVRDLLRNQKKWTVVTFHIPPFSTIGHFPDKDNELARVQKKLLPILEKPEYRVDAIIVSHSHAYLRAGMIRKDGGTSDRTTDFSRSGNLGRYPASTPYIKSNGETAYSYILSGSAGRGFNEGGIDDGGYDDTDTSEVKHPSFSKNPPLDNLTGDNTTGFYHMKGGSVELVFKENRLDVKFIKESDVSPYYIIADSFVVMKDVNKKTAITLQKGGDVVKLKASWIGEYNWYSSEQPNQILTSGVRELTLGPNKSSTFYVRDQNGYLRDTFNITVLDSTNVVVSDTLIPFRSQWLFPYQAGFRTKDLNLNEQCVASWTFTPPAFEMPVKAIIGLGHGDEEEGYKLPNENIERVFVPAEKLWFRRSFILAGSVFTYASFKLTLLMDKNLPSRKSYTTKLQTILINGQEAQITDTTTKDVDHGRQEVTYTLSNRGFSYGVNYILVSFYLTPFTNPGVFPMNANDDPFTFDAQLISTPLALAPPPASTQLKFTQAALSSQQVCAGDTVSVQFDISGNESNFPVVYEAQLVSASGDIPLAEGGQSPILVRMPANLREGDYKIKVLTKSAFMDQRETSGIHVKVLAKATIITPDSTISVWKGQTFSVPVKFEGGGPWNYVLSDGSVGTALPTATAIEVRANRTQIYTMSSVSNSCGVGSATGGVQVQVQEPVLSVEKVIGFTTAPAKTALCNGDSIAVTYSVIGPDSTRAYSAELSDPNGNFDNAVVLGSGSTNPLLVHLPTSLSEGGQYRVRIKAVNPDVDFTVNNSTPITIRKAATGSFTLSKEAVRANEALKLSLVLTGSPPVYYFLPYGYDTLQGNTNQSLVERILTIPQTTVFRLDSVRNVCGYGFVSGSRTVTVDLLVGTDPGDTYSITVYPNPTSDLLLLRNNLRWERTLQWRLCGVNGTAFQRGSSRLPSNTVFPIDISSLSAGLYVLELTEGGKETTWKIIKK